MAARSFRTRDSISEALYCLRATSHQGVLRSVRCKLQYVRFSRSLPNAIASAQRALFSLTIYWECNLQFSAEGRVVVRPSRGEVQLILAAIVKPATGDRVTGAGNALIGRKHTRAIVVTTGMLAFISFWRASAIVLCDMASTVYYIGGVVGGAGGQTAPPLLPPVILFSFSGGPP